MAKKALVKKSNLKSPVSKNVNKVKSSPKKNIKTIKGKSNTKNVKAGLKKVNAASKLKSPSKKVNVVKSQVKVKPVKKQIPLKKGTPLKKPVAVKKQEPVKIKNTLPLKSAPKVVEKTKIAPGAPLKKAKGNARVSTPISQPRRNVYAIPTVNPAHDPKVKRKDPPGRFEIEYVVHTSPGILYEFLTSPSGLSEWFADDVNIKHGIYTFFWDGMQQDARVLAAKDFKYVRYQWLDKQDGSYFEFRIEVDDLTNDVSFIVTDFAEGPEIITSKLLWDSQVHKLLQVIGAY
jgi:uncharacterized protein YndB with AHSA1/START domain